MMEAEHDLWTRIKALEAMLEMKDDRIEALEAALRALNTALDVFWNGARTEFDLAVLITDAQQQCRAVLDKEACE